MTKHYILLCCIYATATVTGWAQPLTYTISPSGIDPARRLHVTVTFPGNQQGVSYLGYQNNQFGNPDQFQFIDPGAFNSHLEFAKEPDSNRITLRYKPGAGTVKFEYEVIDNQQNNQPFYEYCCNNPVIQKDYFHIHGSHLLAAPEDYWNDQKDKKVVRFVWSGFPSGMVLHHSFGAGATVNALLTNAQFNSAVFVGGDYRKYTFTVNQQPVYFLTRGQWQSFSDDTLVQVMKKVVEGHRNFWRDHSDTIYTVTFIPVEAPFNDTARYVSAGGEGLTNSFLSYGTNNAGFSFDIIRYIYVHELMHRWIGIKIENAEEEKQYWFSEGFTEYFTQKNMLRYGLISTEEYIRNMNHEFLSRHYKSPKRAMPNDSMNYNNFWSGDKRWEKLPYERGCIYAMYLDQQLIQHSKGAYSLDDLMREILGIMVKNPGQKLSQAFFKERLRQHLGKKGVKDFERYIERGEPIALKTKHLAKGLEIRYNAVQYTNDPKLTAGRYAKPDKTIPALALAPGATAEQAKKTIINQ